MNTDEPNSPGSSPGDADRARAELLVGRTVLDRYRILELLAIGGMGSVYRGEHIRMRKRVAIKVLHPEMAGLPELVDRFEREAVAGAHIQHPNVASASDFGQFEDGSYYLVLEYVQGVTVHDLIAQGPVPMARAVDIARQIAMGLAAGHARGVIHRDIKPRNIMVTETKTDKGIVDEVKLIDYGFARVPLERLSITDISDVEAMSITRSGMAFGTIAYMAPEIAAGMEHIDQRSDLYSMGIVFYEMLAGKHPFDGVAPGELFLQQRTAPPPPIRLRTPGVGVAQSVEAVVMRLLKKAPEDRFQSAEAFLTALDAAMPKDSSQLGLIPWTSQLKGVADSKPPQGLALPPPLPPHVPYEPKLVKPRGGYAPTTLVLVAVAVVIACVLLVLWLRGFREERAAAIPDDASGETAIEIELGPAPPRPSASASARAAEPPPSATPPPAPSAEAPEADAGPSAEVDGLDANAWRSRLGNAFANKAWRDGADAILALAKLEPSAFEEEGVIIATTAIGVRLEFGAPEKSREVFDTLGTKLGAAGLDILYEMVSGYGGSEGAERALTYLRQPALMREASPALQVVVELREVPCTQKPKLFDRGATLGDERTLALLDGWRSNRCLSAKGHCCFHNNAALEAAISKLKARLE